MMMTIWAVLLITHSDLTSIYWAVQFTEYHIHSKNKNMHVLLFFGRWWWWCLYYTYFLFTISNPITQIYLLIYQSPSLVVYALICIYGCTAVYHCCCRFMESDGSYVVNLPSFLPVVMTSSSSVGVVMSCHVSEASLLSSWGCEKSSQPPRSCGPLIDWLITSVIAMYTFQSIYLPPVLSIIMLQYKPIEAAIIVLI